MGVAIGLAGARLALGPRLVERAPAPGALIPASSELRLTFNLPMEPASVSTRLHLNPSVDGEVRWEGRTMIFRPRQGWPAGSPIEVRLEAGARSLSGLATWLASTWRFSVRSPRLGYLWPAGEPADIYMLLPSAAAPERLTSAGGVLDFSIGAGGTLLAYSLKSADGSTEMHALGVETGEDRLLFRCAESEGCSSAAVSPDGKLLAVVRGAGGQGEGPPDAPVHRRVWVVETDTGSVWPVSAEESTSLSPFWSPQGWLTYVDTTRGALVVVSLADPQAVEPLGAVPSSLGERGAWSPDGSYLIYPDLLFPSEEEAEEEAAAHLEAHLYRWEPATGDLIDLSLEAGERVEDGVPTFSPDGEWIVFGRRVIAAGKWTPGRQLWRSRLDGSQAEPLTNEAFINHGAPAWSPAGDRLAYLRYNVETPLEPAALWWFDLGRRESSQAAVGGYAPAWIP